MWDKLERFIHSGKLHRIREIHELTTSFKLLFSSLREYFTTFRIFNYKESYILLSSLLPLSMTNFLNTHIKFHGQCFCIKKDSVTWHSDCFSYPYQNVPFHSYWNLEQKIRKWIKYLQYQNQIRVESTSIFMYFCLVFNMIS